MVCFPEASKGVIVWEWVNMDEEWSFECKKKKKKKLPIAKSFGPCQPARTAQADMGRNFLQMHLRLLFTCHDSYVFEAMK